MNPAVLKAKIQNYKYIYIYIYIYILNPEIRAGTGPKPSISGGKWPSGPSPGTSGTPGGPRTKLKIVRKHSQVHKLTGSIFNYSMLRNTASGPEIGLPGRILAGLQLGNHRNQPSGRRTDLGAFPVAIWPKSGPEGRFTARKHYCVT